MPETPTDLCKAALIAGEGWQCERCALAWDDGDAKPNCQPLTYGRLIAAAEAEAERIVQSQRAIAEAWPPGHKLHQQFRNKGELKKRMEFLALQKLAEKVQAEHSKKTGEKAS